MDQQNEDNSLNNVKKLQKEASSKKGIKPKRKPPINEPFYDSEEDIGLGPITFREVKARLKRPAGYYTKPVDRRHSVNICSTNIKMDDSIPEISRYLTASEKVSEGESSNASIYLPTTEESLTTKKVDSSSVYLPVNEQSLTDKSSVYFSTIEQEKSEEVDSNSDYTYINFVQKALKSVEEDIHSETQTLIDLTINSPIENDSSNIPLARDNSVISLSDDDDTETENEFELSKEYRELPCVIEESDEKSCDDIGTETVTNRIPDLFVNGTHQRDSVFEKNSNLSPASIPNIDLDQFDDDSFLNTTLEKINAILEQDNLSSLNEADLDTFDPCDVSGATSESVTPSKTCNIISGSFMQKPENSWEKRAALKTKLTTLLPKPVRNTKNEMAFKTPEKLFKTTKITPSTSKSTNPVNKSPSTFKVPGLPQKQNVPKKPKSKLDNIVSPVRMYIKYSPQPVLKQNNHSVEKTFSKIKISPKVVEGRSKENVSQIPKVLYKPSRKQILSSDENVPLPGSLEKMVKKPDITKHDRTVKTNLSDATLIAEADLTSSFANDSSRLTDNNDVSVWHKTVALRK